MNVLEKVKRSWWTLISFVPMLNGLGFVYVGFTRNNWNWVIEGFTYEIPWIFCIFYSYDLMFDAFFRIALVLMLVSIIRSFWLAIKLADVYDNEDKYTVRPTALNNHNDPKRNDNSFTNIGCCFCLIVIFVVYALVAFF